VLVDSSVLGWDVGGANIKVARHPAGRSDPARSTLERAFPLWRRPGQLRRVLGEMAKELGGSAALMGVTMTAELADCFETKRDGVRAVLDAFEGAFPGVRIRVFSVDGSFRTVPEARDAPLRVAAANWMATAMLAARAFRDGLLIDVGSTTTDIVPLVAGRVAALGRTDTDRLVAGELVYTGTNRTPVCAILDRVSLGGRPCRVASEVFAIAADAHRWLGLLDEAGYTSETPDGGGRGREAAARRLARMVCADRETLDDVMVTEIASAVVHAQVQAIRGGIDQVLETARLGTCTIALPIGRGAYLARTAAEAAGLRVPEEGLFPDGPATAVAVLAAESATVEG